MEYAESGELLQYVKEAGEFNSDTVQFYGAELILAIEQIYECFGTTCKGMKAESILLDKEGHIFITPLWIIQDF